MTPDQRARRTGAVIAFAMLTGIGVATPGPAVVASGPSSARASSAEAVLNNFAPDLLHGDDGLPPSPRFPLEYGPVNTALDVDGNAIDAHEAHLAYFEGRYWMYGREWGCGTMAFGRNRDIDASRNDKPECGIVSLSSPDLVHWRVVERDYIPMLGGQQVGDQKPQVVWSAGLHRYLMWFVGPRGYDVAQSTSPGGPWGNVFKPTGPYLGHDLNIMVQPDGSAYAASDVMAAIEGGVPSWDVWVQKLNANLTGTTGTAVRVMSHVSFEGIGFFEHDGYWYLVGGHTCPNCPSTTISYLMAHAPLGPWANGEGATTEPLQPTQLSGDGCMGQDKGANVLPSPSGPVVVEGIMQYRSSPMDSGHVLVHGDNNQAIANTYWWPLRFDRDHHIEPLICQASVHVPLARPVRESSTLKDALDTSPAFPHQLDCRITSTNAVQERWNVAANARVRELRIPVFQRTTNLGPEDQDPIMNGDLKVRVDLPSGQRVSAVFPPRSVSWAPRSVAVTLPRPVRKPGAIAVTLTTTATSGCYGVVVGRATAALPSGVYSATENGVRREAADAQMVLSIDTRK
ncbi:MAG TPA: hypothetical protein VFX12_05465 [Vicinamibacterales bacterium]|nr:hypothetical protein [Vicinamibacterales bacterium]